MASQLWEIFGFLYPDCHIRSLDLQLRMFYYESRVDIYILNLQFCPQRRIK